MKSLAVSMISLLRQYIWEITSVAEELGISGLPAASQSAANGNSMAEFDSLLARILTKIRTARRADLKRDSVALSYQTKSDLRNHLEELRAKINASNLSDALKAALHKKVDAVEAELEKSRTSLRPMWLLAGALTVAGAIADVGGAVDTVEKIVSAVHQEKAAEAQQEQRFQPPLLDHNPTLQITHQGEDPSEVA